MELTPEQIEILSDLRNTINDSIEKIGTAMPLFKEAVQSVFAAEALVSDILADDDIDDGEYNDFISLILKGRPSEEKRTILKRITAVYSTLRNIINKPASYINNILGIRIELVCKEEGYSLSFYSKRNSWAREKDDKLRQFFEEAIDLLRNEQELNYEALAYDVDSNPEIVVELVEVLRLLSARVKENMVFLNEDTIALSPHLQRRLSENKESVDSILTNYVLGTTDYDTSVNNLAAVAQSSNIDAKRIIYALL